MLSHLFADVVQEEGNRGGAKAGVKKKGGSMQTISATHRVSYFYNRNQCYNKHSNNPSQNIFFE